MSSQTNILDDEWRVFCDLPTYFHNYDSIQRLLSTANFDYLKCCAIQSRKKSEPNLNDIDVTIDLTRFACGQRNLILQIEFSDKRRWIVRIPLLDFDESDRISMLSEIATMKAVKQQTTIPVPCVYGFEASSDQAFGYPYIFMEFCTGRGVSIGLKTSVPEHKRAKVAKQLANVLVELQKLSFDRPGYLWCGEDMEQPVEIIDPWTYPDSDGPKTSLEYFYPLRQERNRQIMEYNPGDKNSLTACWVLKTALPHIIIEERVHGPFPLCHMDLTHGNMLWDEDFNLLSIIDWTGAQAAPIELLPLLPDINIWPGLSDEMNRPILELRKLVINFIKEFEDCEQDEDYGLSLSAYMESRSARIAYYESMHRPEWSDFFGKTVAELIFGKSVTWEQLVEVYGNMPLF